MIGDTCVRPVPDRHEAGVGQGVLGAEDPAEVVGSDQVGITGRASTVP
ncbi:hypothetical protein [Kribbella sp. NBC_00359]